MPSLILCWRKRWGMRLVEANHWLISSRLDQPLWYLRNTYRSYIVNVYNHISVNLLEFHQLWLSGFLNNFLQKHEIFGKIYAIQPFLRNNRFLALCCYGGVPNCWEKWSDLFNRSPTPTFFKAEKVAVKYRETHITHFFEQKESVSYTDGSRRDREHWPEYWKAIYLESWS